MGASHNQRVINKSGGKKPISKRRMQHRDHSKRSQHSHIKHIQRTKMGQVMEGMQLRCEETEPVQTQKERM